MLMKKKIGISTAQLGVPLSSLIFGGIFSAALLFAVRLV
jgi:hypothetical protein